MSKRKNNIFLSILLLIFVGQAMASTASFCPMMMNMSDSQMQSMPGMQHSMSQSDMRDMGDMQNMQASSTKAVSSEQNCCSDDGNCHMASCFLPMLTNEVQINSTQSSSQLVTVEYSLTLSFTSDSLYRPPIFA